MGTQTVENLAEIEAERTIEPGPARAEDQGMSHFANDLGRVADEIPGALVMLEADGTVSWLNQATLDLMTIEPLEWTGASFHQLIHHEDRPDDLEGPIETLAAVRVRGGQGHWRRIDARSRTIPDGVRPGFTVLSLTETA